jgi:DeoR/GlpR family transcriptional regulator of sugar metabolism
VLYHSGRADQTVILTGGVRTPSDALAGPFAVAALRTVNVDLVILGVHGMDPRAGFTTPNLLEADTDRALVEAGRRLVVVADHTKWGVIGVSTIAGLAQADLVISDRDLPDDARATIQGTARELVIAGEPRRHGQLSVVPGPEPDPPGR